MKEIKLKQLTISNWRGQNHGVPFAEGKTVIKGKNGCGKSSLMHSFYWLLSSYTSAGEVKNNNLFDNKELLTKDTPKASVEAVVVIEGYEYTLKKVAEAKFVRKRGTDIYEKAASDTYTLYIDNIETSVSDFNAWIERNICPPDMVQYLLDGSFFAYLIDDDKHKARKVLENIIGEVREEDMKGDYSCIREDMKRFPIEAIEERTKNEIKPLKARMSEIPAIIESKHSTLSEYEQIDYESIHKEIESKRADIEQIDATILGQGKAIEPIMGERNRIYDLINEKVMLLNELKAAHNARESSKVSLAKAQLDEARRRNAGVAKENANAQARYDAAVRGIEQQKKAVEIFEQTRLNLLAERDEIKERIFTEESCAYCGQELPYDKQEEARQRFNDRKQRDLANVVARGRSNNDSIKLSKDKLAMLEKEIEGGVVLLEIEDLAMLEEQYRVAQTSFIPFESTNEYARLSKEIDDLKATLPEIPTNNNESLTNAKRMLMGELETLNRRYGLKAKADSIREEIAALQAEQRRVGAEIARLEGKLDKCKEYTQEKADIISYRVNGRLLDCKIEMWSAQKDGTMIPDVVLKGKDDVRYSTLNFSDRIKTCIELARLFASHYGVTLPVWIDEASVFSSGNLPVTEAQMVLLYASDDMYLTYEHE